MKNKTGIWGLTHAQFAYIEILHKEINLDKSLTDRKNIEVFKETSSIINGFRKLNGY